MVHSGGVVFPTSHRDRVHGVEGVGSGCGCALASVLAAGHEDDQDGNRCQVNDADGVARGDEGAEVDEVADEHVDVV